MKRKSIYRLLVTMTALFVSHEVVTAQVNYTDQIVIENQAISKKGGVTSVTIDMNLDNLRLNKNDMLIITPVIVSNQNEVELESIAVKGTLRNKVLQRPFEWNGKTHLSMPVEKQLVRRNGTAQSMHYTATLPYSDWQRNARLLLRTEVVGCADCSDMQPDKLVSQRILADKFFPDFRMSYIVPEVEEVKVRSEIFSAHLNYIVERYDLLPDFQNNAEQLARVDSVVHALKADSDLSITNFTISGYASPEDTYERNMLLSQRRAETFARYMEKKYGYARDRFNVQWFGEDWEGLRKAVEGSSLTDKEAVLNIIDNVGINEGREKRLMELNGGSTYRLMLREYFPPLRRNDYEVTFVSRTFNVEEAKELIKTKPKVLSLNEMYLVANTYPADSPQYREVFDIAFRTFPDAEVACLNAAVGELRANRPDAALAYLEQYNESPAAMNLMGVAYAQKRDTARAKQYFNRAIQAGNADAEYNAKQLQQYIEDNL